MLLKLLALLLCFSINTNAQNFMEGLQKEFIGYGWIVSISGDLVFVPSNNSKHCHSANDFFNEKDKFGFEISNQDQFDPQINTQNLYNWTFFNIHWKLEGNGTIAIVPVIAYYNWYDDKDYGMLMRTYKFNNVSDSISYRIVSSFLFRFKTL